MAPAYWKTRTYYSWSSMKTRCTNPKNKRYSNYAGRGIKVCDRWQNYQNFLEDMGLEPEGYSLDRIDNDKGYEPGNCRWATDLQQANNMTRNRPVEYAGVRRTLTDWARQFNLKSSTVRQRFYVYGWDIEQCLTKPAGNRG